MAATAPARSYMMNFIFHKRAVLQPTDHAPGPSHSIQFYLFLLGRRFHGHVALLLRLSGGAFTCFQLFPRRADNTVAFFTPSRPAQKLSGSCQVRIAVTNASFSIAVPFLLPRCVVPCTILSA